MEFFWGNLVGIFGLFLPFWLSFANYYSFLFFSQKGIKGFWKGVTASYWGISETVIHFVIYEYLKKQLAIAQNKRKTDEKTILDFAGFMVCGACSKTCATIVAYPQLTLWPLMDTFRLFENLYFFIIITSAFVNIYFFQTLIDWVKNVLSM